MSEPLSAASLVALFNQVFARSYRTRLLGDGHEPLYQPAESTGDCHRIVFRHDYEASALHEVAHWCIAGAQRRTLVDYGYWYEPDGRDVAQQRTFEQVEVKPQALEWILSTAAGLNFRLSADNLASDARISPEFKSKVWRQVQSYCRDGLPERAARYAECLAQQSGALDYLQPRRYRLESL